MKFRKLPVVIEAVQWDGDIEKMRAFTGDAACPVDLFEMNNPDQRKINELLVVETLEGRMTANRGDWIIKGVKGEFYPIKNEIFKETYEPVGE